MFKGLSGVSLVLVILAAVILWPWAIIWAINILFGLDIAYTFWSWLAVLVLGTVFKTSVSKK